MPRSSITQADLAQSLGVTSRTVSTAFGASGRISASTRQRVFEAAEKYGYRPNAAARAQRSQRFSQIAVLVRHDMAGTLQNNLNKGAFKACQELDLHLVYAEAEFDRLVESAATPKVLRELCVDGMLVHYAEDIPAQYVVSLSATKLPLVWINTRHAENCVYPDDQGGAKDGTRELLKLGHRRIGYLHQPNDAGAIHYSEADRLEGYRTMAAEAGIELLDRRVPAPKTVSDLSERVDHYIEVLRANPGVTAWLCANQRVANQLLLAAFALGLRVPEAFSVLAFGDSDGRFITGIPISVMKVPMKAVGDAAVRMLAQKIESPELSCPGVAVKYPAFGTASVAPPASPPRSPFA